MTGAQE